MVAFFFILAIILYLVYFSDRDRDHRDSDYRDRERRDRDHREKERPRKSDAPVVSNDFY